MCLACRLGRLLDETDQDAQVRFQAGTILPHMQTSQCFDVMLAIASGYGERNGMF